MRNMFVTEQARLGSIFTVPIETLVQNRFFLRSRETRFENLKTTHRVDLDKPKAG